MAGDKQKRYQGKSLKPQGQILKENNKKITSEGDYVQRRNSYYQTHYKFPSAVLKVFS